MTPTPPPRKKEKKGLSATAKAAWALVAAPFVLVGISLLACALIVLLAVAFALPVLLMWNWGVVEAAPLVGVTLPTIGLAKAFAIALTTSLVRSFFSPFSRPQKQQEPVTIINKGALK